MICSANIHIINYISRIPAAKVTKKLPLCGE